MARLVVLSFEDNAAAEGFVKQIDNLEYLPEGAMGGVSNDYAPIDAGVVEGVFALPTQFCEGGHGGGKRSRSWSRGKKYGWWVCTVCMKPANISREKTIRAVVSQGVNLLKKAQEFVTPFTEGWGSYREQEIPTRDRNKYGDMYIE